MRRSALTLLSFPGSREAARRKSPEAAPTTCRTSFTREAAFVAFRTSRRGRSTDALPDRECAGIQPGCSRPPTFKCTGAATETLKTAHTGDKTVVLLADFLPAGGWERRVLYRPDDRLGNRSGDLSLRCPERMDTGNRLRDGDRQLQLRRSEGDAPAPVRAWCVERLTHSESAGRPGGPRLCRRERVSLAVPGIAFGLA